MTNFQTYLLIGSLAFNVLLTILVVRKDGERK